MIDEPHSAGLRQSAPCDHRLTRVVIMSGKREIS